MEETKKKIEELSFEEAMAELGALVQASESGKLPLEEMLSSLERGHALAVYCRGKLNELERRIEILTGGDKDGPEWSAFDPGASPREV